MPHAAFCRWLHAFVACRDSGDETYIYSIGKMSPFVSFAVRKIYERLNEVEGVMDPHDAWGESESSAARLGKVGVA